MNRFICMIVVLSMGLMVTALGTTVADDTVVGAEGQVGALDKSWTSRGRENSGGLQAIDLASLAKHRSFPAERGGNEPCHATTPFQI